MSKPEFDPGGMGQSIRQMNASVVIYKQEDVCVALLSDRGGDVETWEQRKYREKDKKENFYMVNSMCPILSCWCYAGVGGRWAG